MQNDKWDRVNLRGGLRDSRTIVALALVVSATIAVIAVAELIRFGDTVRAIDRVDATQSAANDLERLLIDTRQASAATS